MIINLKGCTRIVFVFKHFVIKVPKPRIWIHFLKGLVGNIHEKQTWRYNTGRYEDGKSDLLCPVLWASWGGWILVMKRAVPLTIDEFLDADLFRHKMTFPGDDTVSNYGWIGDRIVKIDYADLDAWPSDHLHYSRF